MRYQRKTHDSVGDKSAVVEHVCQHLSACASETDDPDEFYNEVILTFEPVEGGTMVIGELHREPVAEYLKPDYEPELLEDVQITPSLVREPVDLTPEELEAHLEEKRNR